MSDIRNYPNKRRIVLDLTKDAKTSFKATTALNDLTMTEVLTGFVNAYLGRERGNLNNIIERYVNKGAI